MATTNERLRDDLDKLRTLRDEIRVRVHLAGMDVKDAWQTLNAEAERASRAASEASHAAVAEVLQKLREFSDSLRTEPPKRDAPRH
jgi:hypothetical protein